MKCAVENSELRVSFFKEGKIAVSVDSGEGKERTRESVDRSRGSVTVQDSLLLVLIPFPCRSTRLLLDI